MHSHKLQALDGEAAQRRRRVARSGAARRVTRGSTRTKPTEATVCRRALAARSLSGRHDNERLTSARGIGAIGEEITIFERAARIDLHVHTGIDQKSRRGPRQVEGGVPHDVTAPIPGMTASLSRTICAGTS